MHFRGELFDAFTHCLFLIMLWVMIHNDAYFWDSLQPPIRKSLVCLGCSSIFHYIDQQEWRNYGNIVGSWPFPQYTHVP